MQSFHYVYILLSTTDAMMNLWRCNANCQMLLEMSLERTLWIVFISTKLKNAASQSFLRRTQRMPM